jgi:hypothetical protein
MVTLGGRGGIAPTHSWPRHEMRVSGQRHAPAALCPWERTSGTHYTGGWVGLRAGLDTEVRGKSFVPAGDRTPIARSSSRSQTLYWLSYPAPLFSNRCGLYSPHRIRDHILQLHNIYFKINVLFVSLSSVFWKVAETRTALTLNSKNDFVNRFCVGWIMNLIFVNSSVI